MPNSTVYFLTLTLLYSSNHQFYFWNIKWNRIGSFSLYIWMRFYLMAWQQKVKQIAKPTYNNPEKL